MEDEYEKATEGKRSEVIIARDQVNSACWCNDARANSAIPPAKGTRR